MIAIDALRVRYPESPVDAVRSFQLTAAPGEVVVLFGPNGSGKTTGLKAIAGILRAQTREASAPPSQFAYVHQDPYMLHRRVAANIAYGLQAGGLTREEIASNVRRAAERCNITDLLGRRATALSGGQRQRVAIARALALARPVLLLDEPTANLDRESRALVARIVREEADRGRAVVIASHDRTFALAVGDRFYTMEEGILEPTPLNIVSGLARADEHGVDAVERSGVRILGSAHDRPAENAPARAVFRPADVVLSTDRVVSSALNALEVEVTAVREAAEGRALVHTVPLVDDTMEIVVAISRHSVEELALTQGRRVWASFKASSVQIFARPGVAEE